MAQSTAERLLPSVRAWAVLIFGVLTIAYGLLTPDAPALMLGFATLGVEPVARARPA
jgi:hypothetical protein